MRELFNQFLYAAKVSEKENSILLHRDFTQSAHTFEQIILDEIEISIEVNITGDYYIHVILTTRCICICRNCIHLSDRLLWRLLILLECLSSLIDLLFYALINLLIAVVLYISLSTLNRFQRRLACLGRAHLCRSVRILLLRFNGGLLPSPFQLLIFHHFKNLFMIGILAI